MKRIGRIAVLCLLVLSFAALSACGGVIGGDKTADEPQYYPIGDGTYYGFTLDFRQAGSRADGDDRYGHSATDGELIESWFIPFYGVTVYESAEKYFAGEDARGKMTFRLSQHRFYMFSSVTLESGETYDLETVYIDVDGEYASCANFQSVLGDDGVAGTDDDVKVVTIVYKGWLD